MISLKRATRESRPRDRKRNRWVLKIGNRLAIHLTPAEVQDLVRQGQGQAKVPKRSAGRFTLNLSESEAQDLKNLAAANGRGRAEQIRVMIWSGARQLPEHQGGNRD